MKILANDGISKAGQQLLEQAGIEVITTKVAQNQLINYINTHQINGILVRSATQVTQEIIQACPSLTLIGRGGVGMDNIDVAFAKKRGIHVINTPKASSRSVAELVFAHLLGAVRFLPDSNRNMPLEGDTKFHELKKTYSQGSELLNKTLGIIGLGKIGQEVAKIALGCGMKVVACDPELKNVSIRIELFNKQYLDVNLETVSLNQVLSQSDFVTLHIPAQKECVVGKKELALMKKGAGIINTSRGGLIDEVALIEALDKEHLSFAALDTFEDEPSPAIRVLMHPQMSLSPHIGACTIEAQERVGIELAEQIITLTQK